MKSVTTVLVGRRKRVKVCTGQTLCSKESVGYRVALQQDKGNIPVLHHHSLFGLQLHVYSDAYVHIAGVDIVCLIITVSC